MYNQSEYHGNLHGKRWFPANVYVVNGLQSENKIPITWQIYDLVREGRIPATLSPLWGTLGPMLRKVDVRKFGNPLWLDISTFWLLFSLKGMPSGL